MKQVKINIEGKEYTFQRYPVFEAFDMRETWLSQGMGVYSNRYAYPILLENVLIKPKLGIEDFDNIGLLDEVCQVAMIVLFSTDEDIELLKAEYNKKDKADMGK